MMEGKTLTLWAQRSLQYLAMTPPVSHIPFVGEQRHLRHRLDGPVKIAGLIPGEGNLIVNLRGFAAYMDHRPIGHPLLVVDFDGIVANRQDQVRPIGECFYVGAARPTDNAGPVLMAFRQKAL